jgi:1,4-alpha-glucan branching enzyme
MMQGGVSFVLHSHMPFYRGAGRWPHGEETLHEVMAESYLPLLEALTDLYEAGTPTRLTLGITPVLAEQLADPLVIQHFEEYLNQEIEGAADDARRFEKAGEQHLLYLAHFYLELYRHVLETFRLRFGRDITGGFRRLQDAGVVEILTSAATHAYLPLLARDSSVFAQLAIGKRTTERHFGRSPRAAWLPECAYRPAYYETASDHSTYERPGLEQWLEGNGLHLFFVEHNALEGSRVIGRTERRVVERESGRPLPTGHQSSSAASIYGEAARIIEKMGYETTGFVTEKRVVPVEGGGTAWDEGGTFLPYYVRYSDVAVLGRNRAVGEQVWAAQFGYPGDGQYREFHRKDPVHGFQYWKVTDNRLDLQYKQLYDPYQAGQRVQAHADHFVWLLEQQLNEFWSYHPDKAGIIVAAYDTELFGHWWFEGVSWLKEVLSRLATDKTIKLCTASEWLEDHPPDRAIDLRESSWGHQGTHIVWNNPDTQWMWQAIHAAEHRMEGLVARYPAASEQVQFALNQTARELLLLQSSDWEFLYTTGQARQYAADRFTEHANRFNALADALESGTQSGEQAAARLADQYGERDNLFPDIDYRLFAKRQPD